RQGGHVTGICGGYQLLGNEIHDPEGIDGNPGSVKGLGLLNIETRMTAEKRTLQVNGICARSAAQVTGYEIHVGNSTGIDTHNPMTILDGQADGAISKMGNVEGTYLHGMFSSNEFRRAWLNRLQQGIAGELDYEATVERELDLLADGLESALDVEALFADAAYPVFS
ncbi:MAG: adenosylcobyric acid synthase, partial [Porticoccaceae bacterium]